jgi:hypothetical protein
MAVGLPLKTTYANGDVFSASDINDTNGTINLIGGSNYAAGKNELLNGDFRINQRNFSSTTTSGTYGFDRWVYYYTSGTTTYSAQIFTTGAAPVAGYEGTNFARILSTGQTGTSGNIIFRQFIESVRTSAGQTVTLSFWAKAASGTPKVAIELGQSFGTGGSPSSEVNTYAGQVTLSTSWVRYSVTIAIPSISGKTIGTNNNNALLLNLWTSAGSDYNARTGSLGLQNNTFDFWGMQLEAGSTATAFQTATGTIQGELAACQRYYWRQTTAGGDACATGAFYDSTRFIIVMPLKQTMRVTPTFSSSAGSTFQVIVNAALKAGSSTSSAESNTQMVRWDIVTATGATGGQAGYAQAASAGYYDFSAEF